ncbi:MAG: glutathione peroxidase [Rhizobacter sp.]|jgi:glutaredoxin-like protein
MPVPTTHRREGERVPEVSFRVRRGGDWAVIDSREVFDGKNVVVFSLPGAFTPTCSSTHLPRYDELAPVFRARGIDTIACVSVNDPFVMEEWGRNQHCDNILMLPDGNAAFTGAMGMLVDKSDLNFGQRSWRYSMLVRNGIIEKMFVEPDKEGDPFEVSDADTMLRHLDPAARAPDAVAMLSREGCPFCAKAKQLLNDAKMPFVDVPLEASIRSKALSAIAGKATVPQVYVNGTHIGGSEELARWLEERAPA